MRSFMFGKPFRCLYWTALLFVWLFVSSLQAAAAAEAPHTFTSPHLSATLISEHTQVEPGRISSLAIALQPATGTFTQWSGPHALRVEWHGPDGTYFDETQWPAVQTIGQQEQTQYGFTNTHYLSVDYSLPAQLAEQNVAMGATLHWHVCQQTQPSNCTGGEVELGLAINVSDSLVQAPHQPFAQIRAQQPQVVPWPARFDIQAHQLTLLIESQAAAEHMQASSELKSVFAYFPADSHVDIAAAQSIEIVESLVIIRQPLLASAALDPADLVEALPIQIRVGTTDGLKHYELLATKADSHQTSPAPTTSLWLVFVFAFFGGALLNLMPCVFPVLSLKAMALAQGNQTGSQQIKRESLWYTCGVVVTFLVIATTLIGLRAAGQALGWGFQLQNPWLIGLLTLLFVAIGMNLMGVFQVGTRLMGLGQNVVAADQKPRARQSFATGVLAVLVASPCTAPFMGVALGYAITQPPILALSIFTALGLGLAAPFLLIGFIPSFAKLLPKPGAWMEAFKEWMAIPIYITAVWLLWVFGRQTGTDSLILLLLASVLFATALWSWGKQQLRGNKRKRSQIIVWFFLACSVVSFYHSITLPPKSSEGHDQLAAGAWSQAKLEQLRLQQPVFVNMTADWCITCLANERVALHTDATQALFSAHNVKVLTGDWTMQDPAITEYLAMYGRNGVPLYVLYWPGKEPKVLPQILSNRIIREHIEANLSH